MNQQINLYQPIFREQRKLFSLKTATIALTIVIAGLMGIWALGEHSVRSLESNVAQLEQQLAAQEKMAQNAGVMLGAQGDPKIVQAKVQQMTAQLAERTRALDLLRAGVAGEPKGFATRLTALARQHTDGVWLDHLFLSSDGSVDLQGRSIDAELVPKFLQGLTAERELAGTRFTEVMIDRRENNVAEISAPQQAIKHVDKNPTVRFSVSSKGLHGVKPGPGL